MGAEDKTENAIDVDSVVKNFRRGRGLRRKTTKAVDRASFRVNRGELFGLVILAIVDRYTRRSGTLSHY